jgi:hypothetical protein
LIESRPFFERIPSQYLLEGNPGEAGQHIQATMDQNGSYGLIYTPVQQSIKVRMDKLSGPLIKASWYDPGHGCSHMIGLFPAEGVATFNPPASGLDWVLVLDQVEKQYPDFAPCPDN